VCSQKISAMEADWHAVLCQQTFDKNHQIYQHNLQLIELYKEAQLFKSRQV